MSEEDFRVHFPEKRGFFSFYTFKRVMGVLFALIMIAFFVTVGIRTCTMKGSKEMQSYLWTQQAIDAAKGENFKVYSIPAISQPSINATFTISNIYYTEPIGQFQFLLSYNVSKLEHWAETLELDAVPEDGDELFAFVLADNEGNYYTEYDYVTDSLMVNGFYRLVFSGVSLNHSVQVGNITVGTGEDAVTEAVTATVPYESFRLYVYNKNVVDFSEEKMDELTVYEYNFYKEEIKLTPPDAPRADIQHGITEEMPGTSKQTEATTEN